MSGGWAGTGWTPDPEYTSDTSDLIADFYANAMRGATSYDRITGFFSSGAFLLYWPELRQFVDRHGRIRLLCSPRLSEADIEGLERGYAARSGDELAKLLLSEVDELLGSDVLRRPALAFAGLVAAGVIDIKLARVAGVASPDDRRMFHDKVGLFHDGSGRWIGFRGSANESYLGLSASGNVESFDAWPSWDSGRDSDRVRSAIARFDNLWHGRAKGVEVVDLPHGLRDALRERSSGQDWRDVVDEVTAVAKRTAARRDPGGRPLRHQQ